MVDLSEFSNLAQAQDDGIDVNIQHPGTGEDLGIAVRVAGPDSARQKRARSLVNNERIARGRNRKPTAADFEADALKVTAASVISWTGMEESGKPVECTTEAAEDIFARHPWLYEQVAVAVGDRSLFTKS